MHGKFALVGIMEGRLHVQSGLDESSKKGRLHLQRGGETPSAAGLSCQAGALDSQASGLDASRVKAWSAKRRCVDGSMEGRLHLQLAWRVKRGLWKVKRGFEAVVHF